MQYRNTPTTPTKMAERFIAGLKWIERHPGVDVKKFEPYRGRADSRIPTGKILMGNISDTVSLLPRITESELESLRIFRQVLFPKLWVFWDMNDGYAVFYVNHRRKDMWSYYTYSAISEKCGGLTDERRHAGLVLWLRLNLSIRNTNAKLKKLNSYFNGED